MTALVDKMNNRSSGGETHYGFTQQIRAGDSDDTHELVIARLEPTQVDLTNILRWEDDGGQIVQFTGQGDLLNPINSVANS
jgi:hypothetical protein